MLSAAQIQAALTSSGVAITVTFALAAAAYVGLGVSAVLAQRRARFVKLWRLTVVIAAIHVVMVWHVRYSWSLDLAVRNGYAGFVIFHSALLSMLGACIVRRDAARWLILLSFAIVSVGANGAVWRYDVVAIYRVPVAACAALSGLMLIASRFSRNG